MKYRVFRDHTGRIHLVERSREEIADSRRYWVGVVTVSIAFFLMTTVAAGLI